MLNISELIMFEMIYSKYGTIPVDCAILFSDVLDNIQERYNIYCELYNKHLKKKDDESTQSIVSSWSDDEQDIDMFDPDDLAENTIDGETPNTWYSYDDQYHEPHPNTAHDSPHFYIYNNVFENLGGDLECTNFQNIEEYLSTIDYTAKETYLKECINNFSQFDNVLNF